jgi:hypothetical protein
LINALQPLAQFVAVCDVRRDRLEAARKSIDEYYGASACKGYIDFRDIVTRDDIDAVAIATPDHWHCTMLAWACKFGKDAYCEKAFSRWIAEGREAVKLVRRYGRVVQVGNQGRSNPSARFACELVRNGRLGKLHTIEVFTGPPATLADECRVLRPKPGEKPPSPDALDWDLYVGPGLWRPHPASDHGDFRAGSLDDYGAHVVDLAHRALGFDRTGPVEFVPEPDALAPAAASARKPLPGAR